MNLSVICLVFLLSACTQFPSLPSVPTAVPISLPTFTPTTTVTPISISLPNVQPNISNAVQFLMDQYDPTVMLLRESREVAPDQYWLATDNLLATYAFAAANALELIDPIKVTFGRYGPVRHGLVEALTGEIVSWPPQVEQQREITLGIWTEARNGPQYQDWAEYSDLAMYGALNAHNSGDATLARQRYQQALARFDGIGFADKAYLAEEGHGLYATYKLALALYVGSTIGEPPSIDVLEALLTKQDPNTGGFIALYNNDNVPQGDANTETTSYAVLALTKLEDQFGVGFR